jgi:hypothetical protein
MREYGNGIEIKDGRQQHEAAGYEWAAPYPPDYKDAPYTDDVTEAEIRNQANIAGVDTRNTIAFNDFRNEYIRQHANPEYEEEAGTEDRPDYLEREGGTVNAQPYGGETPENPDDDAGSPAVCWLILDEVTQLSQDFAEVTRKTLNGFRLNTMS